MAAIDRRLPRSGINFVCSRCGTPIYHIGSETENMRNSSSRYPKESIFATLIKCRECGHQLNFDIDPNCIKIGPAGPREFELAHEQPKSVNQQSM